jgi:hypothetical protein
LATHLILVQRSAGSTPARVTKFNVMIEKILYEAGGISIDAFESLLKYVAKIKEAEDRRRSEIVYFFKRK